MKEPSVEYSNTDEGDITAEAFSNPVASQQIGTNTYPDASYDNYSSQSHPADGGQLIGDDDKKFTLSLRVSVDKNGTVALIFAASLIVLISGARACAGVKEECEHDDGSVNYAIAVGTVSMIITGILILSSKYQPALASNYAPYVSMFLLLWWGFGASIMTFSHPFPNTGNGYFASWLGFVMSGSFASQSVDALANRTTNIQDAALDRATVFLVFISSVVVIVAAAVLCDQQDSCDNDYAFAVASGVLSACVCLTYLLAGGALPIKFAAGFLGCWWLISTGVLTFDSGDPFGFVGNGYFAVWSCFIGSFYLCYHVFLGGMNASQ